MLACAPGTYALGEAARPVHRGDAIVAVGGGRDAGVTAVQAMGVGVIGGRGLGGEAATDAHM